MRLLLQARPGFGFLALALISVSLGLHYSGSAIAQLTIKAVYFAEAWANAAGRKIPAGLLNALF